MAPLPKATGFGGQHAAGEDGIINDEVKVE
jgi:hypothetical protein